MRVVTNVLEVIVLFERFHEFDQSTLFIASCVEKKANSYEMLGSLATDHEN